jgi:hypothetical protein
MDQRDTFVVQVTQLKPGGKGTVSEAARCYVCGQAGPVRKKDYQWGVPVVKCSTCGRRICRGCQSSVGCRHGASAG